MIKGGYQILDFCGVVINYNETVKIVGTYNKLNSTDKVILVSGLGVGNDIVNDFFTQLIRTENTITLHSETMNIIIDNNDDVSVVSNREYLIIDFGDVNRDYGVEYNDIDISSIIKKTNQQIMIRGLVIEGFRCRDTFASVLPEVNEDGYVMSYVITFPAKLYLGVPGRVLIFIADNSFSLNYN